jgi:hypothetical protein
VREVAASDSEQLCSAGGDQAACLVDELKQEMHHGEVCIDTTPVEQGEWN